MTYILLKAPLNSNQPPIQQRLKLGPLNEDARLLLSDLGRHRPIGSVRSPSRGFFSVS